ncbi:hypothetical protein [Glutamicibacter arilaitensis]|uniref:hypothetical protein n=1 Tax=Glutamicibacter arilaitensis TaxID=256701 RepID=UPI003A949191
MLAAIRQLLAAHRMAHDGALAVRASFSHVVDGAFEAVVVSRTCAFGEREQRFISIPAGIAGLHRLPHGIGLPRG